MPFHHSKSPSAAILVIVCAAGALGLSGCSSLFSEGAATTAGVTGTAIAGKETRQCFVTQTCRQSDGQWRWAAADPAVARWGTLQ